MVRDEDSAMRIAMEDGEMEYNQWASSNRSFTCSLSAKSPTISSKA